MSCFFFFKQKTAYEMRISDWSSDVCSSDLGRTEHEESGFRGSQAAIAHNGIDTKVFRPDSEARLSVRAELGIPAEAFVIIVAARVDPMKGYETLFAALRHLPEESYVIVTGRSEERGVGKEWVVTLRSRWSPEH